jgi:hypothetical protein
LPIQQPIKDIFTPITTTKTSIFLFGLGIWFNPSTRILHLRLVVVEEMSYPPDGARLVLDDRYVASSALRMQQAEE